MEQWIQEEIWSFVQSMASDNTKWNVMAEIQKITRFNHSSMTSKIQQFKPCIKHHKLIHSYLITYIYTYICDQYLTRRRSLGHMMSKHRNKIHSIQERTYSRIQSNSEAYSLQRKVTLEILLLNQTHLMESSSVSPSRLSLYIWSNPTYVFTLGYL